MSNKRTDDLILEDIPALLSRIEALEQLASRYYTMIRVIHKDYWKQAMAPFWIAQKDKAQARAEELGIKYGRSRG